MARLRQQFPANYVSSGNIHTEFENFVKYINAAELGNKTISELLTVLFDESGVFDGPIEMQYDTTTGLQYRVGTYADTSTGWKTLASVSSLKGDAGTNVGTIEGPFFFNRQDTVATSGQTVFSYSFDSTEADLMVFVNGVLQNDTGVYTLDDANNTVTFSSGLTTGQICTIWSLRKQSVSNYRRSDITSTASQVVFAFTHTADENLIVFRNGILQRPGGSNDYTSSDANNTITFTAGLTNGDLVTIATVENQALQNVTGLMLEGEYTDANGKIVYNKLSLADGDVPQAKINGLVTALTNNCILEVSGTTPSSPSTQRLWLDTSVTPNLLKFYNGSTYLQTSPDSTLPTFVSGDANKYVRVNGTGTALEYGTIDVSTLVPKTYMGAANGVGSLDSSGKLPITQLPDIYSTDTIDYYDSGTASNATVFVKRIWKQKIRIDGIAHKLTSGTCTIQLSVDGTVVGTTHNVTGTGVDATLGTAIEIDGTSASKRLELAITSASSPVGLEVGLSAATVNV